MPRGQRLQVGQAREADWQRLRGGCRKRPSTPADMTATSREATALDLGELLCSMVEKRGEIVNRTVT